MVPNEDIKNGKINRTVVNYEESMRILPHGLTLTHFEKLELQHAIVNFLKLQKLGWAGQVVHNIIMRLAGVDGRTKDSLFFAIGDDIWQFSIAEYALIAGMWFLSPISGDNASATDSSTISRHIRNLLSE